MFERDRVQDIVQVATVIVLGGKLGGAAPYTINNEFELLEENKQRTVEKKSRGEKEG